MADETGTAFGRYTAERLLGTGAFATVWLARDQALDAPVAVKVLAENWAHDADVRRRFAEEARILRRLESDNIVRIYDVAELGDGRPYFVMEYADRPDLAARIHARLQEGPFGIDEALDLSIDIADALAVAHAHDVVHRDLKPSNVLFRTAGAHAADGRDERMVLADFGIARSLLGGRATTITAGTPFYMAPEQSEGHSDKRSDIYAAAAILYELISGRVPFPFDSIGALVRAQITSEPDRLDSLRDDVPAPVADLVARGLAREPADRYDDAAAWAAALRAARAGSLQPEPPGAVPEAPRSMAETRIGAGAPAAGAVAAAASIGAAGPAAGGGSTAAPPRLAGHGGRGGDGAGGAKGPGGGRKRRRAVALIVLAAVIAGVAGIALATRDNGPDKASASGTLDPLRVLLEQARSSGPNPFTPPLLDRAIHLPTIPVNLPGAPIFPIRTISTAIQSGSVPGLYGGTREIAVCDPGRLVSFLGTHADKAAAWARVEGIVPDDISQFVQGLTPVVLRSDTTVLNHGFFGGHATPHISVLQTGTAVLVDRLGVPRAKCFCGNPLLGVRDIPEPKVGQRTTYVGTRWPGFDPRAAIGVVPSALPVSIFTLIDVIKKTVFERPAGTTGSRDVPGTLPGTTPTTATTAPAATTTTLAPTTTAPPPPPTDISHDGTPSASSVAPGTTFTADRALDGNPASSWFSAGAAEGENSTFTWTAQQTHRIATITLIGNGQNANSSFRSGYGFSSATIVVQTVGGTTVFSQDVNFGPSMDPSATVHPNVDGVKIVITFHHHQSPQCGGFADLVVLGS